MSKYGVGSRHITAKGTVEITSNENGMVTYFYVNNPSNVITNKLVNLMSNVNKFRTRQLAKGMNVGQAIEIMNRSRAMKFGIEIEVQSNLDRDEIARIFRSYGINAITSRYGSSVSRAWKIQNDTSTGYNGLEVVSPILTDTEELKKVVTLLKEECGANTSVKCGLHVHHDISDLNISQIKNLYKLYAKYESNAIASIIDPRRKNNTYALPISGVVNKVIGARTLSEFKNCVGTRYLTVNQKCYVKYGTIEFRGHGTSLNIDTIISWIELTHKMVETATRISEVGPLQATTDQEALEELQREVGLSNPEIVAKQQRLQKYWAQRQWLAR